MHLYFVDLGGLEEARRLYSEGEYQQAIARYSSSLFYSEGEYQQEIARYYCSSLFVGLIKSQQYKHVIEYAIVYRMIKIQSVH